MNACDVLGYGHQTVLQTIEGLPEGDWQTPGVCGVWSTKDIVAHLASFEQVLVEILETFRDGREATPTLELMGSATFNDDQVALRRNASVAEVLGEYHTTHARVMALATDIPAATFRQVGVLPWYGAAYALDDLIVYMFYGHKREHSAQIKLARKGWGRVR